MTELSGALLEGVVDRLTRPDYRAFEAQLRSLRLWAHQRVLLSSTLDGTERLERASLYDRDLVARKFILRE